MKTYACLKCGNALESGECIQQGKLGLRQLCPHCGVPVCVSGSALIAIGLLWIFLWSMVLSAEAEPIAIVGGILFLVVGVIRLFRQLLAARRVKWDQTVHPNVRDSIVADAKEGKK